MMNLKFVRWFGWNLFVAGVFVDGVFHLTPLYPISYVLMVVIAFVILVTSFLYAFSMGMVVGTMRSFVNKDNLKKLYETRLFCPYCDLIADTAFCIFLMVNGFHYLSLIYIVSVGFMGVGRYFKGLFNSYYENNVLENE